MAEPTSITYAELRDDDILIDKSGGRWHVSGVDQHAENGVSVAFWLGDARTKVRAHHMMKPSTDSCTVDRVETLRDTVEKLEAQWPQPDPSTTPDRSGTTGAASGGLSPSRTTGTTETAPTEHDAAVDTVEKLEAGWTGQVGEVISVGDVPVAEQHDAAVAAVVQGMPGAKVDTDSTAAEVDAAAKSTDDDPVVLPLFETMTPLEQRSHLFVLHGVFADDLDDSKTLTELHFNVTRDRAQLKLRSIYKPHEHSASVTA